MHARAYTGAHNFVHAMQTPTHAPSQQRGKLNQYTCTHAYACLHLHEPTRKTGTCAPARTCAKTCTLARAYAPSFSRARTNTFLMKASIRTATRGGGGKPVSRTSCPQEKKRGSHFSSVGREKGGAALIPMHELQVQAKHRNSPPMLSLHLQRK
eukprot:3293696-Pleurochrysis_carterae.AAC.4